MAEDGRPAVAGALAATATEASPEDPRLATYKQQYAALPDAHKNGFTWEQVVTRLSANPDRLAKAMAMQGGGHLYYVERTGEVNFKDKGLEPVIYGWDKAEGEKGRQLVQIYGHDPEQMAEVKQWANSPEIEARVAADGYELFEDDGNYHFSDDMKRAAAVNDGQLFVASQGRNEWRDSLLKNARFAFFHPYAGRVCVDVDRLAYRIDRRGAVRRLRV
ncbi:hypothetical protein HZA43_05925 [Candidatus Peregrinibacteria bacterium]|nr:hypothetical protein [Candidatus Peregrinibacteria bacterium]